MSKLYNIDYYISKHREKPTVVLAFRKDAGSVYKLRQTGVGFFHWRNLPMNKKKKEQNAKNVNDETLQAFTDYLQAIDNPAEEKASLVNTLFDLSFRFSEQSFNKKFQDQIYSLRIQYDMLDKIHEVHKQKMRKKLKEVGDFDCLFD